jgi:hypothetical protein
MSATSLSGLLNLGNLGVSYDSSSPIVGNWKQGSVLLIALPVFFTTIGIFAVIVLDVVKKTTKMSSQESKGPGAAATTTATPASANKYVDPTIPKDPTKTDPENPPPVNMADRPKPDAVLTEKLASTNEPFLYQEILIHFAIHIAALITAIQPVSRAFSHTGLAVALAWIHFVLIGGYLFLLVPSLHRR